MTRFSVLTLAMLLGCLIATSCGSGGKIQPPGPDSAPAQGQPALTGMQWPDTLPLDAPQPWERESAGITAESEFLPGRDVFSTSPAGASENGEATRLESSDGQSAYASYRIPTGGQAPGVLSLDVNLLAQQDAGLSEYYVGIANYGSGRWQWQGPYSDSHLRLLLPEAGMLSSVNSFFATLLCYGGSSIDIVGVGLGMRNTDDLTAPPVPQGLTASAVANGAELQWNPVIAGDLAGYEIYWSDADFSEPAAPGVHSRGYLEGSSHTVLSGLAGESFVRIRSVDLNGNPSEFSDAASFTPLPGELPALLVSTDSVSAGLGDPVSISVIGADSYDYDTDGDGVFEITDDAGGVFAVDTSLPGIIRPRVRASDELGEAVALGSVSLIVSSNSRPVASASSDKSLEYLDYDGFQDADITFAGIAEDQEDSVEELSFAWDFDGDGIYEEDTDTLSPDTVSYEEEGTYNVKFRVTDSAGAWDVDTLNIDIRINLPPIVSLNGPWKQYLSPSGNSTRGNYNADAINPEGEEELTFSFDREGDGNYEFTETDEEGVTYQTGWTVPGIHLMKVRVTDSHGASGYAETLVEVYNHSPQIIETGVADGISSDVVGIRGGIAVVYRDGTGDDAEFMFSHDSTGTSWTEPIEISTGDDCAGQVSIARDANENYLVVTYKDEITGDIRFTRKDFLNGSGDWSAPASIDGGVNVYGLYNDLVYSEDEFRFSVFYYDETNGNLKYAQSSNSQGSVWNTPVDVVANGDDTGQDLSAQIVSGNPAVCYYNASDQDLEYIRATDPDGTAWGSIIDAHSENGKDVGRNCRMGLGLIGRPFIAFNDLTDNRIRYVLAGSTDGSTWNFDDDDPLATLSGGDGSLCVSYDGNRYFGAYHVNGELHVGYSSFFSGQLWTSSYRIDNDDSINVGLHPSVAVVNGRYVVTYYDEDNGDLRILLPRH